ncbi:MAG TPA: PA14 domain-containing protein [Bacteroidia bacterium]|jgi:hypothetical protein|nr:PA14 domain-containing protein [Bacteroidia bacterium]
MKYRPQLFIFIFFFFTVFRLWGQEIKIREFRQQGEGTSWSPDGRQIAYDMKGSTKDKYYELHIADTNGLHDTCISALCPDIPHRHTGGPNWHPSGKYIMFVAEQAVHKGGSLPAIPGLGTYTDIWIMTRDYKHAYKLTNTPSDNDHGIIGPRFSPDGKQVVWVERKKAPNILKSKRFLGLWVIKTADFVEEAGIPKLENIKTFEPGGDAFYETYGFTADGKRIIFCSNMRTRFWWSCGIFTIDAETGTNIKQLTTNDYNEHAVCSPDGKFIVWMSNTMATKQGTDWWVMRTDGTWKQRLTYFNEPGNPEYLGHKMWAGLSSFRPDCKSFIGGVQYSLLKQEGSIYMVSFLPAGDGNGLKGEYYNTEDFTGTSVVRSDPSVNFRWGPPWHDSLVTSKAYSARWTGYVEPLYSETYTLYTHADKYTSVWVNDTLVIGPKTSKGKYKEKAAQLTLTSGKKYKLRVEYHNNIKNKGNAVLYWSSPHQYKQIIPASQLFTTDK